MELLKFFKVLEFLDSLSDKEINNMLFLFKELKQKDDVDFLTYYIKYYRGDKNGL